MIKLSIPLTGGPWLSPFEKETKYITIEGMSVLESLPIVFGIKKDKHKIRFIENCDYYFKKDLTKEEILSVANELIELSNLMIG